jgi:tetratricopeptide (TPR) repeat protein
VLDEITHIGDRGNYWWARSNVATATGRFEEGYQAGMKAAEINPANAESAHTIAASAAVFLGDPERVGRSLEAMERIGRQGRFITNGLDEFRAALAAFDGRLAEAVRLYGEVVRRFRDLGAPMPAARAALEAVILLGMEDPQIRALADDTRGFWTKLRAEAMLERLDEAIERGPLAKAASSAKIPVRPAAERVPASPKP